MPQQVVFPCPSCGASLSVDSGAATAQCQFCGSTVRVPSELRTPAAASSSSYGASPLSAGTDRTQLAAIGYAVRAGNTPEAIRLYRAQFSVSQTDAQQAVSQLAAGQSVMVGTQDNGMPEYLQVSQVAPAAPYYVPMMAPVPNMPDGNKIFRGVMGFNIALTLAIFGFTACIFLFVFLAVGLAFVPAIFSGFGPLFGH